MEIFQTLPTVVRQNPEENFQIVRADIVLGDKLSLAVDILNMSEEIGTGINFAVKFKDRFDNPLFNGLEWSFSASGFEALPHKIYYIKTFTLDSRFTEARAVEIRIEKVQLKNSKIYKYDKDYEYEFIFPVITSQKMEKIKSTLGPEINTYGENTIYGWRCVCGALNGKDEEECKNCKRNKNFVLNNLTEPLINLKMLNLLTLNENEDKEKLKSSLTQTTLSKVVPSPEEIEEKRINEPNQNYRREKSLTLFFSKLIKFLWIIILILSLSFAGLKLAFRFNDKKLLTSGINSIEEGSYDKALKEFMSIRNKNLSKEKIDQARALIKSDRANKEGDNFIISGDYLNAAKSFRKVIEEDGKNYKSAQDKILGLEKIFLDRAKREVEENNPEKAKNTLSSFLQVIPESAKATALLEELKGQKTENSGKIDEKTESEEEDKTRADLVSQGQALLNSYQKVLWDNANLRKGPSINSEIITSLSKGTDLYIKDTKIEGNKRIWCLVETKNEKTGESFEGWISNKVMEAAEK